MLEKLDAPLKEGTRKNVEKVGISAKLEAPCIKFRQSLSKFIEFVKIPKIRQVCQNSPICQNSPQFFKICQNSAICQNSSKI